MKVTMAKPMIFKAAATLANGGYRNSVLQFERNDDKLVIAGTNLCVMVLASCDATFARWKDGEGVRFNNEQVRAMMRGVSKALKNASCVTIDITKDECNVSLAIIDADVSVSFPYEQHEKPISLKKIEQTMAEPVEAGKAGNPKLNGHFMTLAANAMRTIGGKYDKWEVIEHGSESLVEFVSNSDPARVLMMPTHE